MVKYSGRFVVKDIANNRQYLADMLYGWNVGDNLTGWTLADTTIPTIAADGTIRLYDNTAGGGGSSLYYPINIYGNLWTVLSFKFTRKADDVIVAPYDFNGVIEPWLSANPQGARFDFTDFTRRMDWISGGWLGTYQAIPFAVPTPETEYQVALIIHPRDVICIIDGIWMGNIPIGRNGNAPLSLPPLQYYRANPKSISFDAHHGAGGVNHYRIRDIKIGRLVGVGDV